MSLAAPERFQGLDRFEARKRVVAELEAAGLLEKVESHRHAVGHCYRCDTVIEPRLSEQWFVRMEPLARPALAALPRRDPPVHPRAPGRRLRPAGWRGSATGASRASSGGDTASRCGTARPRAAAGVSVSRTDLERLPRLRRRRCARTRTCSTPGSPPGWCRSPVSAGPTRPADLAHVLPRPHAGLRARDPLLLGRADDHVRAPLHG